MQVATTQAIRSGAIINLRSPSDDTDFCTLNRRHGTGRGSDRGVIRVVRDRDVQHTRGLANRYKNAFSQIDVQLKRRYDLIPNLVEGTKGYISHDAGRLRR